MSAEEKEDSELGSAIQETSALLTEKLNKINKDLVLELKVKVSGDSVQPEGHFSDWHDKFRDGGTWRDSWGRSGD